MFFKSIQFFISMILTAGAFGQEQIISMEWKALPLNPGANAKGDTLGIAGPLAGVHQGCVLIGGGANFPEKMPWENGKKMYYSTLSVYKLNNLDEAPLSVQLPFTTAYGASCSTPKGIVYAGGENENGLSNKVLLLQCDEKTRKVTISYLAELPKAITNASLVFYEGMVYLLGGETSLGTSSGFYCLDLDSRTGQWKQLPSLPVAVSHAVTVSCDGMGNIFLIGGRAKNGTGISSIYSSLFQYNIKEKNWNKKQTLPYTLSAGTGIAVNTNYLLVFGGDKGETFSQVEKLLAAIQNEKDEQKKKDLIERKNAIQSNHPGFSNEILLYNIARDTWTSVGLIPFETPVTTIAIKAGNQIIIPSGEIKAGVRASRILTAELLVK